MVRNKKKIFVTVAGVFLLIVVMAGIYVWWNIGMLDSDVFLKDRPMPLETNSP